MNRYPRIKLKMNMVEAITSMVDGNPGATTVCCELMKNDEFGFINICHLDDMEIYGSDIWLCYKDICGQDIDLLRKKIKDRTIKGELQKLKSERSNK